MLGSLPPDCKRPNMSFNICGIQQIGIGIPDVDEAWKWYRKYFGIDVQVFREAAEAPLMINYTGNKIQSRDAALALNMQGGAGFEIWQYTSRTPVAPPAPPRPGDYGIFAVRIGCKDIPKTYEWYKREGLDLASELVRDPFGSAHFFVKDPFGNLFQMVKWDGWFTRGRRGLTSGVTGCMIGVSDLSFALRLYQELLGYDKVIYDKEGEFEDLRQLDNDPAISFRRILLTHSQPRTGAFSALLGPSYIELIKVYDRIPHHIFKDRYWGDRGFIHLCFDIQGMKGLETHLKAAGFPFVVDSASSFDMGEASGHFSYIEDPDGTLIEFVETHKVPIMKKWGWYLDLRKRDAHKSLPKWMILAMGLNRVRD